MSSTFEEIRVKSHELVDKVRNLIEEGNARRIIIMREEKVLLEIPMTWGVGGAFVAVAWAPILAAVGALAALVADVKLVVEREGDDDAEVIEIQEAEDDG